ncbi:hypothetical protein LU673_25350 [Pseudomonas alloputida]|uniref:hypothetical protein n=1 Tax=Pseudomonas alloputida TaxID=1940621 RepID=UPI001E4B1BD7|nr:hypothetical protein [Pseudomonas alloputida]MCE0923303.1 hypothetical protein [Pseudomonas alloputida]
MSHDMNDALARLARHSAAGLALLPDDLQLILQDTPEEFRRVLGSVLSDIHAGGETDYGRGIDFGRALGIITAGAALDLINHKQQDALMAALSQVKPA